MKRMINIIYAMILVMLCMGNLFSQEETNSKVSELNLGADMVSRYVWRGLNLGGSSPSIQPYIEYSFGTENHAFGIGAWGAYSLSGSQTGQEADLYFSYTFKDLLSLTVTDYFFPDETLEKGNYFNYNTDWVKIDAGTTDPTGHLVEASLSFNGTDKIPVSVLFAMNVWGDDSRKYKEENGIMTAQNSIAFSKYIEIGYSTSLADNDLGLFVGAALDNPNTENGEPNGFYGQENAGIINLGVTLSRNIDISDKFSLPVFGSLICNPEAQKVFIVFGLSI